METIAVYWENKAKTYGFEIERDLSLFQVSTEPHELAVLGSVLFNDTSGIRFRWVLVQPSSRQRLNIYLLLNQKWTPSILVLMEHIREKGIDLDLQTTSPVEMVYFHGPHFGDRYGIDDAALGLSCGSAKIALIPYLSIVRMIFSISLGVGSRPGDS